MGRRPWPKNWRFIGTLRRASAPRSSTHSSCLAGAMAKTGADMSQGYSVYSRFLHVIRIASPISRNTGIFVSNFVNDLRFVRYV
jgi:hypothetical protein